MDDWYNITVQKSLKMEELDLLNQIWKFTFKN